jgi:hypothetical protein
MTGTVVKRGLVTPAGNRLVFDDELLPPPAGATAPPLASAITLGTKDDKLMLKIDQIKGTVDLICAPAPPASQSVAGTVTIKSDGPGSKFSIECGPTGTIDIKTGAGGTVNIDGGAQLNIKAQATVEVESTGMVEVKGNPIKLNWGRRRDARGVHRDGMGVPDGRQRHRWDGHGPPRAGARAGHAADPVDLPG